MDHHKQDAEDQVDLTSESTSQFKTFDVRDMPPPARHREILRRLDDLPVREGLVLVNDHDPKPLYYELRSLRGETFDWEYLQRKPGDWRVQIVKTGAAEIDETKAKFDLRRIPSAEREHTVFHRLGLLEEGEAMELVSDQDLGAISHHIRQQHGDQFDWKDVETGPDRWRAEITRKGREGSDLDDQWAELDVREYVPAERHRLIFRAYEELEPGDAYVLVNDHDPKPLYYQFEAEMSGEFTWEYLQRGPSEWRILIGKRGTT